MNVRAVQAIFDDLNTGTRGRWAYPDTRKWDPERNTREFIAALPDWRRHGVLAFTVNLQVAARRATRKTSPGKTQRSNPTVFCDRRLWIA